jgi:hypothetical protein
MRESIVMDFRHRLLLSVGLLMAMIIAGCALTRAEHEAPKSGWEFVDLGEGREVMRLYSSDGFLLYEFTLRNGKQHGPTRMFSAEGILLEHREYLDGESYGVHRTWDESGALICIKHYEHGKLDGDILHWYPDGTFNSSKHYLEGQLNGTAYERKGPPSDPPIFIERHWRNNRLLATREVELSDTPRRSDYEEK